MTRLKDSDLIAITQKNSNPINIINSSPNLNEITKMPNQDIITALKNAVEHGDNLQNAMQIMVNSGYNPQEVQEASKYVAQGVTPQLQTKPAEQLTMPGKPKKEKKKSFFSKLNPFKKKQPTPQPTISKRPTQPQQPRQQQSQPLTQQPQQNQPLAKQLSKIKPRKHSYIKEIILLAVLIILVGVLITTIIFRDSILRFFSG